MKKNILTFAICMVAVCVWAQPAGHLRQHGHHIGQIERLTTKSNYTHQLVGYHSSDYYEFQNYYYNWKNQLIAVKDTVSNEYSVIDSIQYDDADHLVRLSGWQLLDGTWKNVYYIDYTYDQRGNLASRTNYNFYDNEWCLGGVYNYTYNDDNQIVCSELTMMNRIFQRVDYTYQDGHLVEEMWNDYDGMGLSPSEKITYIYEDGHLARECDSIFDGSVWDYYGRRAYVYDANGNCIEYHYYDHTRGEAERSVYGFSEELTLQHTLMPWNPEMVRPKTYQNVHAYETEQWYTVDVDHVLQYVCDYIYEYAPHVGITPAATESLAVSPNPADGLVTVAGLGDEYSSLQVVDAMGRIVMDGQMNSTNNTFNVSNLPSGYYIVRLLSQGKMRTSKLVVK